MHVVSSLTGALVQDSHFKGRRKDSYRGICSPAITWLNLGQGGGRLLLCICEIWFPSFFALKPRIF